MTFDFSPKGWECPKCGRVYSPSTPACFYCPTQTVTSTTTGLIHDSRCIYEPEYDGETSNTGICKKCGQRKENHTLFSTFK